MKKKIIFMLNMALILFMLFSCKKTVVIGTKTLDVSKTYTVFISQSADKESLNQMRKGFVKGMVDCGFAENINIKYIYENAKADKNIASKIADLAIEKKADVVVTIGEISTLAIKEKIKNTPIVFLGCANAERIGLCDKENNPIENVTGVKDSHMLYESLEYLSTNYENVKKLGVIYDNNNSLSSYNIDYLKFYATAFDIDIYTVAIKRSEDVGKAIDNIIPKVDAIFFLNDDMIDKSSTQIIDAFKNAGKTSFAVKGEIDNENLIYTSTPDKAAVGREAADMVSKLLKNECEVAALSIREVS